MSSARMPSMPPSPKARSTNCSSSATMVFATSMMSSATALVTDRPAHDLTHAVHLVVAREVEQHRKTCEQRHAFREGAEHGERARHVGDGIDPELVHVVRLRPHLGIVAEGLELGLGHAQRLEQ